MTMTTPEPNDGFSVTPARVSFVLGLIALLAVMWQTANYAQDQKHRITAVETAVQEQRAINKDVLAEIRRLSESITELTFAIKGTSLQPNAPANP